MAEQDTPAEAELQLKKRARRRLVGAIALALLAVIVLPMVMDREPRPVSQDIQVRIPSQDSSSLAARMVPGKSVSTPLPAPEPRTVAEPVPGTKAEPKPDAKPASEIVANPAATAKPAEKPVPAKPVEKMLPPAKAAEKPAGKTETKPAAAESGGQWVVQLGAYKEAGNVKLLLSKLKGVNVPAYTEKFDSSQGQRTRVRAGPFPSQEAAEKARSRIKIIGVDGPVAPK
ncbi:MAG: SPOR domain-containing protein [Rhodocyclales bacterium]|nr:SPOR domain-containing protein [Rhodocyclales bacterium]